MKYLSPKHLESTTNEKKFCINSNCGLDQKKKFARNLFSFVVLQHIFPGHIPILEHLKSNDTYQGIIQAGDLEGKLGWHIACEEGKEEAVQWYLQHCQDLVQDFNCKDGTLEKRTGFHQACVSGRVEVVKLLLQQGKDVIDFNSEDHINLTGFNRACKEGREGMVKLLLQLGQDVIDYGARDRDGESGYDFAKEKGKTAIVEMLEEAGLDFAQEKPFWFACQEGRVDEVKKTISERADIIKSRGAEGFILACSGIAIFYTRQCVL